MIEINIDATSLGDSSCILKFKRTVIGELIYNEHDVACLDPLGGYKTKMDMSMLYGVCVHKFIDVMYKTKGHIPTARNEANRLFTTIPVYPAKDKVGFLNGPKHLFTTCFNVWEEYIQKESDFEVLEIPIECWRCKGTCTQDEQCSTCGGSGIVNGPATERTFRILIYEDKYVRIFLCGTIDRIGKIVGGCYAIRDWKTTTSWDKEEYFYRYWLSRQLRIYTLACKLEAKNHPDSILGRVGATNMVAVIDGIFLAKSANDNSYNSSEAMQFPQSELDKFHQQLLEFCEKISFHVAHNYWPKEGILNGACDGNYGKVCKFFPVCKSNETVGRLLLNRDFQRKPYNPLNFNE